LARLVRAVLLLLAATVAIAFLVISLWLVAVVVAVALMLRLAVRVAAVGRCLRAQPEARTLWGREMRVNTNLAMVARVVLVPVVAVRKPWAH
tara:strand:- start:192 stop:467 length:276 start_codon:yes stop_codon:yes gene_type:complete